MLRNPARSRADRPCKAQCPHVPWRLRIVAAQALAWAWGVYISADESSGRGSDRE